MSYAEWTSAQLGAPLWQSVAEDGATLVLPDAALDLMWFKGELVVAGPDTCAITFTRSCGDATWGARLAPGVAHALLGVSAHELLNLRVPLADIVGVDLDCRADADGDVVRKLETTLFALYERADPPSPMLALAGSIDAAARAGRSARDAAVSHGISERSLHRVSVRWFGYGYKTLMQIHRFQRARRLVQSGASLVQAALGAGYADQAHLARECRRFSGMTPSALTAAR